MPCTVAYAGAYDKTQEPYCNTSADQGRLGRLPRVPLWRIERRTFCVAGTRYVGTLTCCPAACSSFAAAMKSSVLPPVHDLTDR